jgi:glycosyltransferase involved in cell wall biosynthesis
MPALGQRTMFKRLIKTSEVNTFDDRSSASHAAGSYTGVSDRHNGTRSASSPCVSVCLPVYNGERHIHKAIRSILNQTFEDFELIISDNASTDGTHQICRKVATQDRRVCYVRGERNRGLAWNFNWASTLAWGRYLVWIGHDDVMAPDFISRCVEAMEGDSDAVLCFTNANYIDDTETIVTPVDLMNPGESESAAERFSRVLYDGRCDPICGLMKTQVLRETRLHGAYADSDRVLLAEMCFRGRFHFIPDRLFSRRMHALQTTSLYPDRWARTLVFDPNKAGKASCPWLRELLDFGTAICRAPICWSEKYKCIKYLYWWFLVHKQFMSQDLRRGFISLLRRVW